MNAIIPFLMVFLGGGLGSMCRFGISLLFANTTLRFPWPTMLANVAACILLGILLGWQLHSPVPDSRRLLLTTGFCGGFSTFSTFSAETWELYQSGHPFLAIVNVFASLVICLLCIHLGVRITS